MYDNLDNEEISVKMFGFFDIKYKNKSILRDVGSSAKSLDILKFLMTQKGIVFLPEAVAENVWPGNDYVDERKVVRTYVHRLRKILAGENSFNKDFSNDIRIVNVKGSYKAEMSDNVVMDIDIFQNYCSEVTNEEDTNKLLDYFNKITSIYTRKFLEENRMDAWVVMFRNYYLRIFCATVNNILDKLSDKADYSNIRVTCEKSLKIYDLDEGINIHFLNAMIESNQISGAMQHYTYITGKMQDELKISPSDKMKAVYNKLKLETAPYMEDTGNSSKMEEIDLRTMIREIIMESYSRSAQFSVGYVKIVQSDFRNIGAIREDDKVSLLKHLKFSLEASLRKGDMFALTDVHSAIIVLQGAREEYFNNIAGRISDTFFERYGGVAHTLDIKIFPATDVK